MTIEFIPATCPSCGGELRLPNNRDNVNCMYCGQQIIIHNPNNDSQRANIENWMKLAEVAESSNSEEAYGLYTRVLEIEPENWIAWYGKAKAAGYLSTIIQPRLDEMVNYTQEAINYCPENEKEELLNRVGYDLMQITSELFLTNVNNYIDNKNSNEYMNLWDLYDDCLDVIDFVLITSPKHKEYKTYVDWGKSYSDMMIKLAPVSSYKEYFLKRKQRY